MNDTTDTNDSVDPDRTEQVPMTDPTRQVPMTDSTQQLPVDDSATTETREPVETTVFGAAASEETSATRTAATEQTPPTGAWPPPVPSRPTGPHAPAILLGLVALAVAGIVLAQELGNLTVDWGDVGPLGFVAVGAVLVVLGAVGLIGSNRRNARS